MVLRVTYCVVLVLAAQQAYLQWEWCSLRLFGHCWKLLWYGWCQCQLRMQQGPSMNTWTLVVRSLWRFAHCHDDLV